jgi:hypothetical protein
MGLYKINVQARLDTLGDSKLSRNAELIKNLVHRCYAEGLSDQRIMK